MTIDLKKLASPSDSDSFIMTIAGEAGSGKTSLASLFPSPVFILTEDGTKSLRGRKDVKLFPLCTSSNEVIEYIKLLSEQDHDFKTLVIDSISQLNVLIESETISGKALGDKGTTVATIYGGYHQGYDVVALTHLMIRDWCSYLKSKIGMNIVFTSHIDTETKTPPDGEPYTRYTLLMNKKSAPIYCNNVDLVAFIKNDQGVIGDGKVKRSIKNSPDKIITCYSTDSHISKNRYRIKDDLIFKEGINPLIPYLFKDKSQ